MSGTALPQTAINEQLKLIATAINNVGLAFAIGGFIAPVIGGTVSSGMRGMPPLLWVAVGVAFHMVGQAALRRIR